MAMFLSYTADASQAPTPALGTKSITQNGTYNASSDGYDGYSSVSVNVPSGGGNATVIDCGEVIVSSSSGTNVTISNYTSQYSSLRVDTNFLIVYDSDTSGDGENHIQYNFTPDFRFSNYLSNENRVRPQLHINLDYDRSTSVLTIRTNDTLTASTTSGVEQLTEYMTPVHLYIYIPLSSS